LGKNNGETQPFETGLLPIHIPSTANAISTKYQHIQCCLMLNAVH